VAELNAVEPILPVTPEVVHGRLLRLKVVRPGPLALTYKYPCDASDAWFMRRAVP